MLSLLTQYREINFYLEECSLYYKNNFENILAKWKYQQITNWRKKKKIIRSFATQDKLIVITNLMDALVHISEYSVQL